MTSLICATIALACMIAGDIPIEDQNAVQVNMDTFSVHSSEIPLTSSYRNGFNEGWKAGWRYVKGSYALVPMAPLAPLPRMGEDNFQGGYNRGFVMAMDRARRTP